MTTPILNSIETAMASMILAMTKAHGYNFDWAFVNEEDDAIDNATTGATYPRAIINPVESVFDKETCVDTLAGFGSQDYTNEVLFTVLAKTNLPTASSNPLFDIRNQNRLMLDDLKKLFGTNYSLNGTCDNIMYSGSQGEPNNKNDVQVPAILRTFWKIIYSQDRRTPTQYASA